MELVFFNNILSMLLSLARLDMILLLDLTQLCPDFAYLRLNVLIELVH